MAEFVTDIKFKSLSRGTLNFTVAKKFIASTEYMNMNSNNNPPTLIRPGSATIVA